MESVTYRTVQRMVKLINVTMMTGTMLLCWVNFYTGHFDISDPTLWLLVVAFAATYTTYSRIYDGFQIALVRITEMIYSQSLALVMTDGIMYVVFSLMARKLVRMSPMLGMFAVQFLLCVLWTVLAHRWYFSRYPAKRTAIVFDRNRDVSALINAYGLSKKFDVRQTVSIEECLKAPERILDGMQTVFLCGISSHERNVILKLCVEKGITVYVLPKIGDLLMSSAVPMHLFHLPFLRVRRYDPAPEYLIVKRLFDIVVSLCALIVLSPVMVITAIAIKCTDGGPVFYRQCRLTRNGARFDVLKFRSMRVDAEKDGVARLCTGDRDPRITAVGHVIRKVRIDELPQLINILKGEMSIVGPRPERLEIAAQYEQELPEFSLRLQAKAGLTGYAQVYGKYNTTPYDKLQMDLMYIAHPSFWKDLRIIFATVKILFLSESTEGIGEGMQTAMTSKEKEYEMQ